MRFLVLGAGGIGCFYGARLISAGHDVTFVARGAHLTAMQQNGLQILHDDFHFNQPVTAVDTGTLVTERHCDEFDLIVLALKAGATAALLAELSPWLNASSHPQTPVLSLQNGVDNEPLIAKTVGAARTLGGLAVRIGGHVLRPGVVEAKGPAQVICGAWPNSAESDTDSLQLQSLCDTLNDAGIPTQLSGDIRRELWRKLVINNGVNPLSALTGLDTRSLTSDPALGRSVYRMMHETVTASAADGVNLGKEDADEMFDLISQFDAIKTSMLVDREKGHPLELDAICGAVLDRSARLGAEAPVTELVNALLTHQIGACRFFTGKSDG